MRSNKRGIKIIKVFVGQEFRVLDLLFRIVKVFPGFLNVRVFKVSRFRFRFWEFKFIEVLIFKLRF